MHITAATSILLASFLASAYARDIEGAPKPNVKAGAHPIGRPQRKYNDPHGHPIPVGHTPKLKDWQTPPFINPGFNPPLNAPRSLLESRLEALEARAAKKVPKQSPEQAFDAIYGKMTDQAAGVAGQVGKATKAGLDVAGMFLRRRDALPDPEADADAELLEELYAREAAADAEAFGFLDGIGMVNKGAGKITKGLLGGFLGQRDVDGAALMELYARAADAEADAFADPDAWMDEYEVDF